MTQRKSVNINGFRHKNPIPNASRVGNLVITGVILGRDADSDEVPTTLEGQCALMFKHMRTIIETAGGTTEHIAKVTIWLKDPSNRDAVNAEWKKMFPNPASRPARHTLPDTQDWPYLVSCDFTAFIDE